METSLRDIDNLGSYASPEIQRCPVPFLKQLHDKAPVYQDPVTGMYLVTRYEDIAYVTANPAIFSSTAPIAVNRQTSVSDEVRRRYKERGFPELNILAFGDPPEHSLHRALVDKVFTPSYIRRLEPYIFDLSNQIIDRFIEDGRANLMADFAVHLPLYIIADQLGVDRADYAKFKFWSSAWNERNDPNCTPDRELELTDHLIDLQNYLHVRALRYLDEPNDKLLSRLLHAEVGGRRLTMGEAINIVQLLLVAGNDTTTTMITSAMYLLLKDPALMARLIDDERLIINFIEEALRAHPPAPHLYRLVMEDTRISGVDVPKGAIVQISWMGGNYDPTRWEQPECINIDREGVRNHLSFGRGIHFCVGNQLARGEMRVSIRLLLQRLKELRLSRSHPEPQFVPHFQIHLLDHLQVEFMPGEKWS